MQNQLHVSAKKYSHHQADYKNKKETFNVEWVWDLEILQVYCYTENT